MAAYYTKVTRKGQITIPAPVRRELGLEEGDRVSVSVEDGRARIERVGSVVARTAGALKTYAIYPPPTAEEMRELATDAWAEEAFERDQLSQRP